MTDTKQNKEININKISLEISAVSEPPVLLTINDIKRWKKRLEYYSNLLQKEMTFGTEHEDCLRSAVVSRLDDEAPAILYAARNVYLERLSHSMEEEGDQLLKSKAYFKAVETYRDAFYKCLKRTTLPIKISNTIFPEFSLEVSPEVNSRLMQLQQAHLKATKQLLAQTNDDIEKRDAVKQALEIVFLLSRDSDTDKITEYLAKSVLEMSYIEPDRFVRVKNVIIQAIKAICYGVAASGLYEIVKMWSTRHQRFFWSNWEMMEDYVFGRIKRTGILKKLQIECGSENGSIILSALYYVLISQELRHGKFKIKSTNRG